MSFIVVIPARLESSRLPRKVLADIDGKPMIQWVAEKANHSGATKVIIATDSDEVAKVVEGFGSEVCMTSKEHQSGTERLGEVVEKYNFSPDQIIVNVQGDEPFIPVENIKQVAGHLAQQKNARMSTLAVAIKEADEAFNPNSVKVVCDKDGYAMYFSRSIIPYDRKRFLNKHYRHQQNNDKKDKKITEIGDFYLRHVGIYAYRASFIRDYITWPVSDLEKIESLEQLRVLWQGEKIHVSVAKTRVPVEGVDTAEDLAKAIAYAKTLKV